MYPGYDPKQFSLSDNAPFRQAQINFDNQEEEMPNDETDCETRNNDDPIIDYPEDDFRIPR
jgi:hypothetical protein